MTVKAILSRKGGDVVTIAPTANLAAAVQLLAERRIGAIVVTGPDDRVAGILSERDIVRTLAARGPAALDDNVAAVMTRKVTTCTQADTVASIMEQMTEGKFRHLPVVEQGHLAELPRQDEPQPPAGRLLVPPHHRNLVVDRPRRVRGRRQ